jgi:hypothetical protein
MKFGRNVFEGLNIELRRLAQMNNLLTALDCRDLCCDCGKNHHRRCETCHSNDRTPVSDVSIFHTASLPLCSLLRTIVA